MIGKNPRLLLWMAESGEYIKSIGSGFFSRAVCAVCFSHDALYICAIGCDDHHSLGVWDLRSAQLIAESKASNGVPPQIHCLRWFPEQLSKTFVTAGF